MLNQKTPSQHNSTLFISPMVNKRRQETFITPPNPQQHSLFETPGSNQSLFFNLDRSNTNNSQEPPTTNGQVEPLTQAEKLRLWRHDALMQHHYKTAEFIGDKVLALTDDPNDAFWLGQVYFNNGNYLRAKLLLTLKPEYEKSVGCRYLAAFALVKLEEWDEALDLVGEVNPFKKDDKCQVRNHDGGIKLEALMCYLRGKIYANQNNFERAKECYKEAILVDVKCFEAFDELINNNLMTPMEEWDFITQLNYRDADDNDELVKLLYITRLSKYLNVTKFDEAEHILREEYSLDDNADILLSRADYLFIQCNFDECLLVCERVLSNDAHNTDILPNYLLSLYELGGKNKLFLKAHQLAESKPQSPMTWLAIGIYYLSIGKIVEARKFFSKATLLNPNFGQAWIGFAHTFAAEGEHEQAISAYAFAARLFPGTHLPNLFLGMQHLQMNNLNLSEEYLLTSYQICNTDPLLLNELGVINFHRNNLVKAELFLSEALSAAKYLNSDSKTWVLIHSNLGHVFRKGNQPYKALECFGQVLKSTRHDSNVLAAMGLIYLKLGSYGKAIEVLHDALAVLPTDPVASDLLKRALEQNANTRDIFALSATRRTKPKVQPAGTAKKSLVSKLMTPLNNKTSFFRREEEQQLPQADEVDVLVQGLVRGEESSEDDEVMDIESE